MNALSRMEKNKERTGVTIPQVARVIGMIERQVLAATRASDCLAGAVRRLASWFRSRGRRISPQQGLRI